MKARSADVAHFSRRRVSHLALIAALLTGACDSSTEDGPRWSASAAHQLPGDAEAGTTPETWHDFVLAQDAETIVRLDEQPGPRADFEWPHATGPWQHPAGALIESEAGAVQDGRVPLLSHPPAGHNYLAAAVLGDEAGVAEVWVAYLREGLERVSFDRGGGRPAGPDDATITIVRSLWRGKPLYVSPLVDDRQGDGAPAVRLVDTRKVEVDGRPAIMRLYATEDGAPTYPFRVPSVALNWFEGDVSWAFQSHFLSPEEALAAAESISDVTWE
jgi:hypothetical protein